MFFTGALVVSCAAGAVVAPGTRLPASKLTHSRNFELDGSLSGSATYALWLLPFYNWLSVPSAPCKTIIDL